MLSDWRLTLKICFAKWMIKLGRLTHSDYSAEVLNNRIARYLPTSYDLDVPAGKGSCTLLQAEVILPKDKNQLNAQLLGRLLVEVLGNPIYRAHIIILLKAKPDYVAREKRLWLTQVKATEICLVSDEYSLLKDTQDIISLFLPKPMQKLLTGTLKSAAGLLTVGGSDAAISYLKLYLSGSKQKILDYHKPQLQQMLNQLELSYRLDESDWQEKLFARYGKEVAVEQGQLRFKF